MQFPAKAGTTNTSATSVRALVEKFTASTPSVPALLKRYRAMNKIAIMHDWFDCIAGSEKVVKQMVQAFPDATVFSTVDFLSDEQRAELGIKKINTSFIQKLPFAKKRFRNYLPLMPLAVEQLDLSDFDVILSSSHAVAKGIITSPQQLHVSYVHTPIRYAWELQHEYLKQRGLERGLKSILTRAILHYMRNWDRITADRPDYYIANSRFIGSRIRKTYDRPSQVIYPPVDVSRFQLQTEKEDFYLAAGRLVPYKRFDLVVEAFSKLPHLKLKVIGAGPEFKKLKSLAGDNVELLGFQSDAVLQQHMQQAKAFVFAALEDFGIMPVEAQACGTPVIGFAHGGTQETVIDGKTGLHFKEQTTESLTETILAMEELPADYFEPSELRQWAEKFGNDRFRSQYKQFVQNCWKQHQQAQANLVAAGFPEICESAPDLPAEHNLQDRTYLPSK